MTPDQLPAGLRVKRPTWTTDASGVSIADGTAYHITAPEEDDPDGRFTLWCGEHDVSEHETLEDAQHAMYLDLVSEVCAQLELNQVHQRSGSPAVIPMPTVEEKAHQKDAQRYQYLRDKHNGIDNHWHVRCGDHIPADLNSEIDAAIQEQTSG